MNFLPNKSIFLLLFLIVPTFSFAPKNQAIWGFFAHQQINRLAVYTLPPEMLIFFKPNIELITSNAVNPDKRRYAVKNEGPRHFIDLDAYNESDTPLPYLWKDALDRYGEDSLLQHGIVPWHVQRMKFQLTEAFKHKNAKQILHLAADLGHYIADANVPLHTTRNYNGQLSGQEGLHAFWESRLPELFAINYDFFIGQAEYIPSPPKAIWQAVRQAHACLDSVFNFEKNLTQQLGEHQKYSFEERNGIITKNYSKVFSEKYHQMLQNQVERQMRTSVKMVGDFWLSAWIDAGQPDLASLGKYQPNSQEMEEENKQKESWLKRIFQAREEGN